MIPEDNYPQIRIMGVIVRGGKCLSNRGNCPRGNRPTGVMVLGGSCPGGDCPRGSRPMGVIVLRGSCPQSSCPQGSCPQGSCPRGSCPRGPRVNSNILNIQSPLPISLSIPAVCFLL